MLKNVIWKNLSNINVEIKKETIVTKDNFHLATIANFTKVELINEEVKNIFESGSGSKYFISLDEKRLYRVSNHWGDNIRSCKWFLDNKEFENQEVIGLVNFEDMIILDDIKNNLINFWNNIKNDFKKRKELKIRKNHKLDNYIIYEFENIQNSWNRFFNIKF